MFASLCLKINASQIEGTIFGFVELHVRLFCKSTTSKKNSFKFVHEQSRFSYCISGYTAPPPAFAPLLGHDLEQRDPSKVAQALLYSIFHLQTSEDTYRTQSMGCVFCHENCLMKHAVQALSASSVSSHDPTNKIPLQ